MHNMLLNNYMEAATMSEISREDAMELLLKCSGGYQFEENVNQSLMLMETISIQRILL